MTRSEIIELFVLGIGELREIELDYRRVDGERRWGRIVAPWDVGSRNPEYAERNKNKAFVFSSLHKDRDGFPSPQVVGINIENISRATLLNSKFDPHQCREISKRNSRSNTNPDGYDWGALPDGFNIARDRDWF